jgi:hypothetical protein
MTSVIECSQSNICARPSSNTALLRKDYILDIGSDSSGCKPGVNHRPLRSRHRRFVPAVALVTATLHVFHTGFDFKKQICSRFCLLNCSQNHWIIVHYLADAWGGMHHGDAVLAEEAAAAAAVGELVA